MSKAGRSAPRGTSDDMRIVGYADRWTVHPGERIEFKVSTARPEYEVEFVRLIQGDASRDGLVVSEEAVNFPTPGHCRGRIQHLGTGSYVFVDRCGPIDPSRGLTLAAWVQPTTPDKPNQGVISSLAADTSALGGIGLLIDAGRVRLEIRDPSGEVSIAATDTRLTPHAWYFVAASVDPQAGVARVFHRARDHWPVPESGGAGTVPLRAEAPAIERLAIGAAWLEHAGRTPDGQGHFNGRIEAPAIYGRPLTEEELVAIMVGATAPQPLMAFDFSTWRPTTRARCYGSLAEDGLVVNNPGRAVRGRLWDGSAHNPVEAPSHFAAIHFHDDDLADAGWRTDFGLEVPGDATSGVYAARLTAGDQPEDEEHIPFVVAPSHGRPATEIAVVLPTLTYLAYGNEHFYNAPFVDWAKASNRPLKLSRQDRYIATHPELGPSLYDVHSDGTINTYVSRLRPIVNFRPKVTSYWNGAGRHLSADLYLIDWLTREGFGHDILTDEDLHHEGAELLSPYRAVIFGSHPEYWTLSMRDSLIQYLEAGGHALYLGGNGLFWVSSVDPDLPHILEVRKSDITSTTPGLGVPPGESHHSTTGEKGGTWKERGLPPETVVGVGYAGQGFATARPFHRRPPSYRSEYAWIFQGVDGEVVGDFGLALGGGAAGDEFDRADVMQGSPTHVEVLASSSKHDDFTLRLNLMYDWDEVVEDRSRADIAYLAYPNGGGVFAAGSMSWMPSLPHNDYRNNVATITRNVLNRFLEHADEQR